MAMDAGDGDGAGMCLPYDVILDILRRLPCSTIAQSRIICRAWCAIVDDHGLLSLFFSSCSFPGVFTNHTGCRDKSYFLAAPASRTRAGAFGRPLFCHGWARVEDHCNGLLLVQNNMIRGREENDTYVCNPVTVRCDALPRPSSMWGDAGEGTFLAFDPAMSLHYERCTRCAARHLYTVKAKSLDMNRPSAEYWRGSLYVARHNGILMILHCMEGTYDLVPLPGVVYNSAGGTYHLPRRSLLASYEKGVHYAELNMFQLKVWALMTGLSDGQLGWTLLHDANHEPHIHSTQRYSRTTQSRMEWQMVKSSKSMGLFTQKDDTNDGVDDEEVEGQDTGGDGINNGFEEHGNEVEDGFEY
ncbi:hypothetical protein ACQ4PT_003469 [Festuca glaucescens]